GLEQRPAVAELGFPEPGAGFANDQGVNDTRLSVQRRENGGPRPRLSPRPQWALAQYNVIAVEGFEPAVQYLQDGLGVFFIVGRGPDQFAADGERFGEAPAVIVHCQLRALGIGV